MPPASARGARWATPAPRTAARPMAQSKPWPPAAQKPVGRRQGGRPRGAGGRAYRPYYTKADASVPVSPDGQAEAASNGGSRTYHRRSQTYRPPPRSRMGRPVGRPIRAPGRRPRVRTLRVMADDLLDGSLEAAARALRDRAVSARELTDACLARIERLEPTLNAFITLTAEPARERARQLDDGTAARSDRPLRGIPVALKDLFDVAGVVTTAGSRLLAENVAPESATAVAKLEDAGVVELGKLNLHECAFGVTTDNPHYGPTRNPWALDRITGGSIRIPAALCGVVGLKPTRGRISLRGVVPLSWTLDHAGPMARTLRDAAILLQAIAGHDPLDPASVDVPVGDHLADLEAGVRGLRIGVARDPFFGESAQAVADAVDEAVGVLESEGARIEEVALPRVGELREAQGVVLGADAAAYHRE